MTAVPEGYGCVGHAGGSITQEVRMRLPDPVGPISTHVADALRHGITTPAPTPGAPVTTSLDAQTALWMLYELTYRGFEDVPDDREWEPGLIGVRRSIEDRFERELREATTDAAESVGDLDDVGDQVLAMAQRASGVGLSGYLRRDATREQITDFLRERSVQQLKESDPQSFLLPRLDGPAKVALAEIQYDEYGAGRPEQLHQALYAAALDAVGLDATYGAYVSEVSALSLASANVMSLFALNRRLCGAGLGHFAAFEASSAVPSRRIAAGLERLGLPNAAAAYFLEHVEADSVHEQVAARELCGSFVAAHPSLRGEVVFGAACALWLDAESGTELLARWTSDRPARDLAS
jgi:hypothetical protein